LFDQYEERPSPLSIPVPENSLADSIQQLGTVTIRRNQDGETVSLGVIEIVASDAVALLRNRVGIRNLAARLLSPGSADGLLVATTQPGNDAWRFTFIHRETRFAEDGALERVETPTRRFTYVLGPNESCRTPDSRFQFLAHHRGSTTLAQVLDAFSVEKLSDEFFATYKQRYQAFCAHLIENTNLAQTLGIELVGLEGKERDRALKPVRDFVKKLLGRLVFLHFIQKKGWLGCQPLVGEDAALPQQSMPWIGGSPDFLREMFQTAPPAEQGAFHSSRLVPLFFHTLNAPEREGLIFPITGTRVPYLNGGLFEPDFDGVQTVDFPAPLFAALLEFFRQYHFTIDENDPEDHEIGIDPEMLGRIFENLLEDNKDKGAYYTPKPVVQYMCQQSLIHALRGRYPDEAEAPAEIERLVRHKEPIDPRRNSWLARHATDLSGHLDDLRICDPAIGSGAFPIGLLQEIYWTKLTLNPSLDRAHAKRGIIQHCIHGVDLDAGAVEIARLRFWLALIVDEDVPSPLPNLDYQIMQGNSLLESFEGERLDQLAEPVRGVGRQRLGSDVMELDLGGSAAPGELTLTIHTPAQHNLAELREDYYACHDPVEKAALRARIDSAVLQAIDARLTFRRDELHTAIANSDREIARKRRIKSTYQPSAAEVKAREKMQAELDALAGKSARLHTLLENPRSERPFFLWHLWFKQILADAPEGRGGFDIVIANPPYVRQEAIKDQKLALKAEGYECFDGVADLLVYFYECAVKKLRPGGVLTFITSNKFYRAGYGEALRGFLARELTLHRLIDFGDAPVFDAIAYASILEGSRRPSVENVVKTVNWQRAWDLSHLDVAVEHRHQEIAQRHLTTEAWRLEDAAALALLEKLRATGRQLNEYVSGRFYNGVKGGHGDAFVVDQATRDSLVARHPSSAEVLKPYLRGRNLKRWIVEPENLWLIYIPWHFPLHGDPTITSASETAEVAFATNYPAIYEHLLRHKEGLCQRDQTETGIRYEWYALARPREEIQDAFIGPKIILGRFMNKPTYAFDDSGFYHNDAQYLIAGADKFLVGVLNSSVPWWFLTMTCTDLQNGYIQALKQNQLPIPIPAATPAEQATLSTLVDSILLAKRAGEEEAVRDLEGQIDRQVFRLYGLTLEEIALVRGANG
jgi:hypothetical protein